MSNINKLNNTSLDDFLVTGTLKIGTSTPVVSKDVTVQKSNSGGNVGVEVRNTSSSSSAVTNLLMQAPAGNSYVSMTQGATSYSMGYHPGDHTFRVTKASNLSGTNLIVISSTGSVTRPSQSSFIATGSTATQTNVTGDGTAVIVNFPTVLFNNNGDYNATNTYTCPADGMYRFSSSINLVGLGAGHDSCLIEMLLNGFTFSTILVDPARLKNGVNNLALNNGSFMSLSTGNTVQMRVTVSGSTKTVSILASGNTWFSGGFIG